MLQNLQNFPKLKRCQLDNLVDFEKCCRTRIYLQKSVPIQPKMSNILPKMLNIVRGLPRRLSGGLDVPRARVVRGFARRLTGARDRGFVKPTSMFFELFSNLYSNIWLIFGKL